jgi:hypothetical protein
MPLTDEEADSAFELLSSAMREFGYVWVTNQVEEKLAFGKVQAKKIQAREYPEPTVSFAFVDQPRHPIPSKPTSAVFAVSEPFSPQERLGVLLDGIDLAIPVVGEVAAEALANLGTFGSASEVEFAPEAEVTEEFRLSTDEVSARRSAGSTLRGLVDELRRELGNAH